MMAPAPLTIDSIAKIAQNCVQSHPTLILGSGASVPHRIRGMGSLAEELTKNLKADDIEESAWETVRAALEDGSGLENALQSTNAPQSLIKKIINLTWKTIATDDLDLLQRVASGEESLPLAYLIRRLFYSTNYEINIITPNYDRVAEYATDIADHYHYTGFVPGIVRKRKPRSMISIKIGKQKMRTVRIWKVHGSLDWFEDFNSRVLCLPLTDCLPDGYSPLIVTPGISKYERTHDEPFRSAIQGADEALGAANAVLCVGFGFRDRHIQPRLEERCMQKNVPIVILSKTLTTEAKEFLHRTGGNSYLAMEKSDQGTRVFTHEAPDGFDVVNEQIWSLNDFNRLAFPEPTNVNS